MTTQTYDTGTQAIVAWADEGSTPGTAVLTGASYHILPITPGGGDFTPALGLQAVEVAAGALNVSIAVVPRAGGGTWSASFEDYPNMLGPFKKECGVGNFTANNTTTTLGTLQRPKSFTLMVVTSGVQVLYPGCRCTAVVYTQAVGGCTVRFSGIMTQPPAPQATPLTGMVPFTGEDPYDGADRTGGYTLISGGTSNADIQSSTINIGFPTPTGAGDSGSVFPNIAALAKIMVSGTIMGFFSATNIAEFNAAIAPDGTGGSLAWALTKSLPSSHTISQSFAIPNAKYTNGKITIPKDSLDIIQLPWTAYAPSLGNQLTTNTTYT